MRRTMIVGLAALTALAAEARVDLGTPFADGMVLQRERAVPVWGTAEPGRRIVVSFAGNAAVTTADAEGRWRVELPAMAASKESRTLRVEEKIPGLLWDDTTDTVETKDVLVGEVWMCSGQSNADCPIWGDWPRYRDGMGAMTLQTTRKPFVRFAKTSFAGATTPKFDYHAEWMAMTPALLEDCKKGRLMPSAVGYYYAFELANALDVPIGIVESAWGGSNIDAWTPSCGYEGLVELADVAALPLLDETGFEKSQKDGVYKGKLLYDRWYQQPSALWNGMVAAYVPMACRGVIWYQGCHSVDEPQRYCSKMHALYNGWSKAFGNPDLKLYFVQLAPWGHAGIANIQMAQAKFAAEEKNAAMAVINDTGNLTDCHPNDKRTVAKRLAAHALRRDYGWTWVKDDSPTFKSMTVEGDRVTLRFDGVESWYLYNPTFGDASVGFEIAGQNGVFKKATLVNIKMTPHWKTKALEFRGQIEGRDLVLRAEGVSDPCQIRYLHSAPWFGGLYNEVCLPLGAFAAKKGK